MTMRKSVQFDNADDVLTGYAEWGYSAWALFCGKDLIIAHDDEDDQNGGQALLQQFLEKLSKSAAIYTLRVYKNVPEGGIVDQTPYKGSFNFKLLDKPIGYLSHDAYQQYGGNHMQLLNELQTLKLKTADQERTIIELTQENQELEAELNEAENKNEPNSVMGMIRPYLPQLMGTLFQQLGLPAMPPAGKLGAIPTGEKTQEELERDLNNAFLVLCNADPEFPGVMLKMASLCQQEPKKFATYMSTVKAIL